MDSHSRLINAHPPMFTTPTSTRRQFLKRGVSAAAVGLGLCVATPFVYGRTKRLLRVLGTHVTLHEDLRQQAQRDLGFDIQFTPGGSSAVLHQAATRPDTFDLYEQWSNSMRILWQAGSIQPIEIDRLTEWDNINNLTKTGKVADNARIGAGDAPHKLLYVQNDRTLGSRDASRISFLPYVHNVDSFGYNTDIIPRGKPYETESWGWLLDRRWSGKVALVNAPTIGLFDAVLAAQAAGFVQFNDIGNLTREDIDRLFKVLLELRRDGHFRGVWNSVPQSIELMDRGEVVIESMFSPAVSELNRRKTPCVFAAPREGYRAWHGVMCLSAKTSGGVKDAAYDYMNWWLSGWPGAFIARQGYYISNPERSQPFLKPNEWDYWYGGKPAREDLKGTAGQVVVKQGATRNGGSYETRLSNIAVWNTVMNTYEYSLLRWSEFLLS